MVNSETWIECLPLIELESGRGSFIFHPGRRRRNSINPTVAIIGASRDRSKFGNISVRAHSRCGYDVFPINLSADKIEGHTVYRAIEDLPTESVDRVSVYLQPTDGVELLEAIQSLGASEVWFNPGSVDEDLRIRAQEIGLRIIEGCSIVDLGVDPWNF